MKYKFPSVWVHKSGMDEKEIEFTANSQESVIHLPFHPKVTLQSWHRKLKSNYSLSNCLLPFSNSHTIIQLKHYLGRSVEKNKYLIVEAPYLDLEDLNMVPLQSITWNRLLRLFNYKEHLDTAFQVYGILKYCLHCYRHIYFNGLSKVQPVSPTTLTRLHSQYD